MEKIGIFEKGDKVYKYIVAFLMENGINNYLIFTVNNITERYGYKFHFNILDFIDESAKLDTSILFIKSKDFFKENSAISFIEITESEYIGISYFFSCMNYYRNNSISNIVIIIINNPNDFLNGFELNETENINNPYLSEVAFINKQISNGKVIVTKELTKDLLNQFLNK